MKVLFFLSFLCFFSHKTLASSEELKVLKHEFFPIKFSGKKNLEASGLAFAKNRLFTVNDAVDPVIYELKRNGEVYEALVFQKVPISKQWGKRYKLDLEGIAFCNNRFYLADERDRFIYEVPFGKQEARRLPIERKDYESIAETSFSAISNFGFEGIACDQNNIYAINERNERLIFKIDQKKEKVVSVFEDEENKRSWISPLGPDYSDAVVEGNFLYAVWRSAHRIQKFDLKTQKVVATLEFPNFTELYYDTIFSIGMVEGIALDKKHIYLAVDGNEIKLFPINEPLSALFILERPSSF